MSAEVDHGLDGENVSLLNLWAMAWLPVIRNLRILVHASADAVTNIVPHHRVTMALRHVAALPSRYPQDAYRRGTAQSPARDTLQSHQPVSDSSSLTVPTGTVMAVSPTKPASVTPHQSKRVSPSCSSYARGEAVNHLFVDRGADRIRKTVIALKRRQRARVANHSFSGAVHFQSGDARLNHLPQRLQAPTLPAGRTLASSRVPF